MKKLLLTTLLVSTIFITGCGTAYEQIEKEQTDQQRDEQIQMLNQKIQDLESKLGQEASSVEEVIDSEESDILSDSSVYSFHFDAGKSECVQDYKAVYDIKKDNENISTVDFGKCGEIAGTVKQLLKTKDYLYFSLLPAGLGGYILYGDYMDLFRLNLSTNSVEEVFSGNQLTDVDFSKDSTLLVYRESDLIVKNLIDNTYKAYQVPFEGGQYGNFKFSPDSSEIAIAVGYGPEEKSGEVYILDLSSGEFTLYAKTPTPAYVDGWLDKSTVIYRPAGELQSNAESADNEGAWTMTPGEVKSIDENQSTISVDLLTINPDFMPGLNDYFLNQSTELREFLVDSDTKYFKCGEGPDGNETTADVLSDTGELMNNIENYLNGELYSPTVYFFDINDNIVSSIYGQCLP